MTQTTSQGVERPPKAPAVGEYSVQARASLWALGAAFAVCIAYTLLGGPKADMWGSVSWLREAGNFVISPVPAVYFTVYCTLVALHSNLPRLEHYLRLLGSLLVPGLLFMPLPGVTSSGDGPLIYVISAPVGFFVGIFTFFLAGIPGFIAAVATASALAFVPVLLTELGLPAERRVRLMRQWWGVFGSGLLTFGLFLIAMNEQGGHPSALGFITFLPHVIAAGGLSGVFRFLEDHLLLNAEERAGRD
jgi:hypothetical protein